jgi:hypothetical protein
VVSPAPSFSAQTRRRVALACLGAALGLAAPGCASRYKADAEPPTYAAQAKISVKLNKTGNRQVRVEMLHLAPPTKIANANKMYMVWFSVPGSAPVKAGALEYNARRRRGLLRATTPNPKFEVVVTIEQTVRPTAPSDQVILRKLVSKI